MGLLDRFRKSKKEELPQLDREDSLSAKPVLNRLVKTERDEKDNIVLHVPRPDNSTVRWLARVLHLPPYKKVALDELGTFVIERCDGEHTVEDIVDKFTKRFKLNRREAEVSTSTFLRNLARRSIIGLVIEAEDA
ncbi:MAG: PqqD family protein [Planctomycetota bacterium]